MKILKRISLPLVIIITLLIIILLILNIQGSFDPPALQSILNTLFYGVLLLTAAFFAAKIYLKINTANYLFKFCALLIMALGAVLAGWLQYSPNGRNVNAAIFYSSFFVGSVFNLFAALWNRKPNKSPSFIKSAKTKLIFAVSGILLFTVLFVSSVILKTMPVFVDENGFTMLGQIIRDTSIIFLFSSSMILVKDYQKFKSDFLYWYSIALIMIAIYIFGSVFITVPVGYCEWLLRFSGYLGCLFLYLAILSALKETNITGSALAGIRDYFFNNAPAIYKRVVETSNNAICSVDQNFNVIYMNPAAERMFGTPKNEVAKTSFVDRYIADSDKALLKDDFNTFLATGTSALDGMTVEIEAIDSKNRKFPIEISIAISVLPAGYVSSYIIRDITEKRELVEAIRESEEKYRELIENANSIIIKMNEKGIISYFNEYAQSFFGYSREEVIGKDVRILLPVREDMSGRNLMEMVDNLLENPDKFEANTNENVKKNGEHVWVSWRNKAIRNSTGDIIGNLTFGQDVTQLKHTGEKLRESEERFRAVQENSLDRFTILKPYYNDQGEIVDFTYVYQNARAAKTAGSTPEELAGRRMTEIFSTFPQTRFFALYKQVAETKQALEFEHQYNTDGVDEWFHARVTPLPDGIAVATQIITERKRAEEALLESEKRLKTVLAGMTDAYYFYDREWRFADINSRALGYFGRSREDLIGQCVWELYPHSIGGKTWSEFQRAMAEGVPVHFENKSGVGTNFFELHAYPEPKGLAVYLRDITERKKAEEALELSYKQIQNIIDNTSDMVYAFDLEERFVIANNAAAQLFNSTPEELIGKSRHELMPVKDADWHETNDRKVIKEKRAMEFEEYSQLEGRSTTWLTRKFPLTDTHGIIYAVAGLSTNISTRKLAEMALKESEKKAKALVAILETADKNKNEFLSTLSHELRNPLAAIMAGLSLLELSEDKNQKRKAQEIMKRQIDQLCHLVDDLLDLTRITNNKIELKKERVDLNKLALMSLADHKILFERKEISLEAEINEEVLYLDVDSVRMKQIIGNLLYNAMKFTNSGGTVKLSVFQDNNEVVICVKDNGIGITSEMLPNIFQPFIQADNSLDRKNGGLGLGLSIVKGISELHGGRVSVYSEGLGKGAQFSIQLPLAKENI